jgi:ParB family transcriptional regulator, chromosome partitioning protein
MAEPLEVEGRDVELPKLVPLNERHIHLQTSRGYRKILCSIRAVGLIEPLCVFEEDGRYVILDGYLRYMACKQLGMDRVPCLVHGTKEAYTYNRMVNQLSGYQEMRMLRRALQKLEESEVAEVFGLKTIRYRLSPTLLKKVHPDVGKAFEEDLISRNAARELACVKPERQAEIVREMRRAGEFALKFIRAQILKTDPEDRLPGALKRMAWTKDAVRQKELVESLREAEQKHDFYTGLYRQYTTDLLRMVPYVRAIITTPSLADYLDEHHPSVLSDFRGIVLEPDSE